MEWYVIIFDVNKKEFVKYNVFNNSTFSDDIEHMFRKKDYTWLNISDMVRSFAAHSFWSRCEYELVLNSWPDFGIDRKIDVYWQLEINWKNFIDYIYEEYKRYTYGQ